MTDPGRGRIIDLEARMKKGFLRAPNRLPALAVTAFPLAALAFAAAKTVAALPVPTTVSDFRQLGTSMGPGLQPIQPSGNCKVCHGGYDVDQEPYARWQSSLMAQSVRDPIFRAAFAIANQDMGDSGYLCLRCHAPGAWLAGRNKPDGSELDPAQGDFDGVTCHVCHRMVDPFYEPGVSPPRDQAILAALLRIPTSVGGGMMIIDPDDVRRGPFDLGPNFFLHDWAPSPFHKESLLCATCHDVSNPELSRQPDGSYEVNAYRSQHPTHQKEDEFPIERTYGEWSQSAYAQAPIETNGRFGGSRSAVSSCQDCHMPKTTGTACQPVLGGAVRDDLPLHEFHGANSWVLDAVRSLYPDSETGLSAQSVADAHARNAALLGKAVDVELAKHGSDLVVRVVNQSGHKLPTGYGEGRRMWIHVRFFSRFGDLVQEHGAYDAATATLTQDTRVYEVQQGLDAVMAALTGLSAGPTFHFMLNNTIVADGRIPPRGFSNAAFEAVQASPVGASFAEQQYWDDASFAIPSGAVTADVEVFHQTTTKEYIEFLRDANTSDASGATAYAQWVANGRSAPVRMAAASIDLRIENCRAPIPLGVSKRLVAGTWPSLASSGTPSATSGGFAIEVHGAKPNVLCVLYASVATDTRPFAGALLYLASPFARIATVHVDANGAATIPIAVTPVMAGTELDYQAVFRDLASVQDLGVTNALHVEFCQ